VTGFEGEPTPANGGDSLLVAAGVLPLDVPGPTMVRIRTVAVLLFVVGAVTTLAGGLAILAVSLDSGRQDAAGGDATAVGQAVETLHREGITGEDVAVGVLDVSGFETDRSVLGDRVVERRQFGDDATAIGAGAHGTRAARTVARVAPDAELYLGTFETPADYERALDWLLERDVDVIVAPVAHAGTLGDGNSQLSRVTTAAVDQGVTVVAPAGNLGRSHWIGEYSPTAEGVHAFGNRTLNPIAGQAGRAEFWLTTDGEPGEYRLELHELGDGRETELVARSVPYEAGAVTNQRLTVRLDDGQYGLVVRGPPAETGATIRVASGTHSFARTRPARSVAAPAAARGVLSVGAFDPATNRTEPYSSRGPTLDGRLGVHVVAPGSLALSKERFEGSSASASFTGGVAALVVDAAPQLDAATVRQVITATADPLDGVNAETGHGRIAPAAAVAQARARTEGSATVPTRGGHLRPIFG